MLAKTRARVGLQGTADIRMGEMVTQFSARLCRLGRVLAGAAAVAAVAGCSTVELKPANGKDSRTAVRLSGAEREHLRQGMRVYLESVQGIVDAVTRGRLQRIAEAARPSGMASVEGVPLAMMTKVPPEFTMLSVDTHRRFDALATDAAAARDKGEALKQLNDILANCTACHGSYRIVAE